MRKPETLQWLQNLQGVDALAILTDSDLISHKNGHALYYDSLEALENDCIIISSEPEYFLENLKSVSRPLLSVLTVGAPKPQAHTRALLSDSSPVRRLSGSAHCYSNSDRSSGFVGHRLSQNTPDIRSKTKRQRRS